MALSNKDGQKIPKVDFARIGEFPRELFPFGYNIGAAISETILVYLQGLFMDDPNIDHNFEYSDKSPIKIVNQGAFAQLELGTYPVIVVERGTIQGMGRGGINNLLSWDVVKGSMEKVDLFNCPVNIKVYADYTHAEQYASLIFMSLSFLTEPLKKFTIYKVQPPQMSGLRLIKRDSKPAFYTASVSTVVFKEGYVKISPKHYAVLRKFAFKGRQVFASGDRVIIRIS